MDGKKFDSLTKSLAQGASRRSFLRGAVAAVGGGAAALIGRRGADAQWSVQVCMPSGTGYTLRLVPKSSVPLYQRSYGAVLPTNGVCPVCQPQYYECNGTCQNTPCGCVPDTCSDLGVECGTWPDGCGSTIWCGDCTADGPNGYCDDSGQCQCTPNTCSGLGYACGTWDDGCNGSTASCGNCFGTNACCAAGTARAGQCGLPNDSTIPCFGNNWCCSNKCVKSGPGFLDPSYCRA
jgi:hypothetical protein